MFFIIFIIYRIKLVIKHINAFSYRELWGLFHKPFSHSWKVSVQNFEEIRIKGIEHPSKFDPSIPFSIVIFNIIDEEDYKRD